MEPYKDLYTVLTRSVRFLNRQFESTAVFFSSFSSFLVGQACCTAAVFCEISNTSVSLAGEMHLPAGLHRLLAGKEVDDYPYTDVFTGGEIVRLETEESPHGACIVPVKNRYFVYAAFVVLPDGTLPPESVLDLFATLSVLVAGVLEKLQQSFDNPHFVMTRTHFRQDILDSILDALPDPFFVKDTSGRYVRCNKAFREFVGKSSEELIGNRLADFTTDPNLAIIDTGKGGTVCLSDGTTSESEIRKADGTLCSIVVTTNAFCDGDGEVAGIVGSIRDISQLVSVQKQFKQKNTELMRINSALLNSQRDIIDYNKRLTESEEKYRLLIENQQEFIVKIDLLGQILFKSQSMTNFLPADIVKSGELKFQMLLAGTDRSQFNAILRESALDEKEHEVEFRMRSVKNTISRISWSFKPVYKGRELDYIIGVGRDVTARWNAERELSNYRTLLETAFEQSPNGSVLVKYPEKTVMFINQAAQRFLKLPEENYVGRSVEEIHLLNRAYIEKRKIDLYEIMQSEKLYHETHSNLELTFVDDDGKERIALLYSTPIYNSIGELISYLLIFPEITELSEAERRIEQQNRELQKVHKLESIGVLAGGIAHDFNNILGAVLGNLSLVRMYESSEKVLAIITKAENAVARAKELTNQLLTFSKGGAPVKKSALLNDIIRDSAMFTLHGSSVDIHFDLDPELFPGLVDTGQVSQVVQNLVINAVQAMPSGGLIVIQTENVYVREGELPLDPGSYVKLTVSDNGSGIAPDIVDRIFDPFFTTKPEGSGLGLATSYNIIKNHGGYITLDTGPDGTSFYIFIPVSSEEPFVLHPEEPDESRYTGTALIMDDEEPILDVASQIFSSLGFDVHTASDGKEAVEKCKKRIESGSHFDLYVLDLTVPGGMGGEEALGELRRLNGSAYFIVSSGYANNRTMSHYSECGFTGILEKPYTIRDVRTLLKEISYEKASHPDGRME